MIYKTIFTVHLVPATKPDGWPNPVYHEVILDFNTFKEFKDTLDGYLAAVMRGGIVIMKPTNKPWADDVETMNLRQLLPIHMISFVEQETEIKRSSASSGEYKQ